MINIEKAKRYCREDISLIKNYNKAINDKKKRWVCHHINELTFTKKELIKMNMYYNRPANELIYLTESEHCKLHYTKCAGSDLRKSRLSNSLKGRIHSEETKKKIGKANKGKTKSKEIKNKISAALKRKTRKPWSDFGKKFKEHFGITKLQNIKLYNKEKTWYHNHNHKCRWEE